MLNLTKPRYVLPVHGDHRRLSLHGQLAEAVGIPPKSIFHGENGLPLELDSTRGARFGEREQAGMIFVDGMEVGDIEDVALRDRRMLSADGIFIVVATVSEQDGRSVAPPEIIFRGVPFVEETDELRRRAARRRGGLARALGEGADQRDRPAPGPPARRRGRVRLQAPAQAPDDPAGRRGGLGRASQPARRSGQRAPGTGTSPRRRVRDQRHHPAERCRGRPDAAIGEDSTAWAAAVTAAIGLGAAPRLETDGILGRPRSIPPPWTARAPGERAAAVGGAGPVRVSGPWLSEDRRRGALGDGPGRDQAERVRRSRGVGGVALGPGRGRLLDVLAE